MMKIHRFTIGVLFGFGLWGCSASPEQPMEEAIISLKGNCGNLGCEELWRSLHQQWPAVMANLAEECPAAASYGFEVWNTETQSLTGLWCWQEPEPTGETYGHFYRTFPYPDNNEPFLAEMNCWEGEATDCKQRWQQLEITYPEEIFSARQTCAFRNGFLLQGLETEGMVDVVCGFFAPSIQIDDDGDGIRDGEGKPTGVDILLGSFALDSLK